MHGFASAGALVPAGAGKTDSDQQKEARSVNRVGNGLGPCRSALSTANSEEVKESEGEPGDRLLLRW